MKPGFTQAEARWFQEQGAAHRDEIRALRKLISLFAKELEQGGLGDRMLAVELRARLSQVKAT
jgi:hypothetical protein